MALNIEWFMDFLAFVMVIAGAIGMMESKRMVRSIMYFLLLVLGLALYLFVEHVYYLSLYLIVVYSGVAMIFILFMGMFLGDKEMKEGGAASSLAGWAFVGILFFLLSGFSVAFNFPVLTMHDIAGTIFGQYGFVLLLLGLLIFSALASVFSMIEEVEE